MTRNTTNAPMTRRARNAARNANPNAKRRVDLNHVCKRGNATPAEIRRRMLSR